MTAVTEYLYTQILEDGLLRRACGRIRALGIKGASYCKAVEAVSGHIIRIPGSEEGKLHWLLRDTADAWCVIPDDGFNRGSVSVHPEGHVKYAKRGPWFSIEEFEENVVWTVVRIMHGDNGAISHIEPKSFRTKTSAINWIKEVRVPEVASWYDCCQPKTEEASDWITEHSVYLSLPDKKFHKREQPIRVDFDILKTEIQDNA
jgi:hypothetical protein